MLIPSNNKMNIPMDIGFFSFGAILLCAFATMQKVFIGAPLVMVGYLVPALFGGVSGVIIGRFFLSLKRLNEELETKEKETSTQLESALQEVKSLKGIIPICSHCNKIRTKSETWQDIQEYIEDHTDADLSHSICPGCAEKHYPGMGIYDDD